MLLETIKYGCGIIHFDKHCVRPVCRNVSSFCGSFVENMRQNARICASGETLFGSLEVIYLCKCNMYYCKNTSLLTGGSSTHKTSSGARTGIVRCPDGHWPICKETFLMFLALIRHRMMSGHAPYGARSGTVDIVR